MAPCLSGARVVPDRRDTKKTVSGVKGKYRANVLSVRRNVGAQGEMW